MTDDFKDSKTAVHAYSWQGNGSFPGADIWIIDELRPGDKLVQLDYPRPNTATETASNFFTSYEELQKHIDPETGKVDMAAQSARLIQQTSVNYWVTYGVFKGNFSSLLNSELYDRFVIIRQ